jgi:nicotinamide-nucleotide amidase
MKADIITIGDELLIGQVIDTNSAWIGQELSTAGIAVRERVAVSDNAEHIVAAIDAAKSKADLILITGGLGPTRDDITKKTLCDYFGMGWKMDEQVLNDVTQMFARFGKEVSDVNKLQAQVPDGCVVLRNSFGSAPGMWFEREGKIFVSMPGVPHEMKGIMTQHVLPMLRGKFSLPVIIHKTILTQGIGESVLAEKISGWEDTLEAENMKLAYLPSTGQVRLRISAFGTDRATVEDAVNRKTDEVLPLIRKHVFGYDADTLEGLVGKMLTERKQTLCTAESCTGGLIAHKITSVVGSSAYYTGSIIAYAYEVKMEQLDVPPGLLAQFGAVSEECVRAMAEGARLKLHTDYAISASGIAGPAGGLEGKPVGTVWIALASAEKTIAKEFRFGDNRGRNIERTANAALFMLWEMLEKN